jgi:hypothetical protein
MRAHNPIREGLKKHSTAYGFYLTLKERAEVGLTALEWDWYRARQKEFEPEVYAAEMLAAQRRVSMDCARKLSIEDLQTILDEKLAASAVTSQDRS